MIKKVEETIVVALTVAAIAFLANLASIYLSEETGTIILGPTSQIGANSVYLISIENRSNYEMDQFISKFRLASPPRA